MTETHATPAAGPPVFPPGRYGRRRERRRRPALAVVLAMGVLIAGTLIAVRLYRLYGDPLYDAQLIGYTGITDTQVVVDFRVNLPPGGAAVCALRARSYDGVEVGRVEVPVRAEPQRRLAVAREVVRTTARPFIGEVVRCRPAG
ncbi:MAG TPA: DUF4307 domain-containing protein [Catenuloplanes sp.]